MERFTGTLSTKRELFSPRANRHLLCFIVTIRSKVLTCHLQGKKLRHGTPPKPPHQHSPELWVGRGAHLVGGCHTPWVGQ